VPQSVPFKIFKSLFVDSRHRRNLRGLHADALPNARCARHRL